MTTSSCGTPGTAPRRTATPARGCRRSVPWNARRDRVAARRAAAATALWAQLAGVASRRLARRSQSRSCLAAAAAERDRRPARPAQLVHRLDAGGRARGARSAARSLGVAAGVATQLIRAGGGLAPAVGGGRHRSAAGARGRHRRHRRCSADGDPSADGDRRRRDGRRASPSNSAGRFLDHPRAAPGPRCSSSGRRGSGSTCSRPFSSSRCSRCS